MSGMRCFVRSRWRGCGRRCWSCIGVMNGLGLDSGLDTVYYTYVLKACVASSCGFSLLKHGKEHSMRVYWRHGYNGIVHIMTTLIDMYARFGCVMYAGFVFSQMAVKNVVSWSAMIACYARNGMLLSGWSFFEK
ncbi:hypothetical protein CUMW_119280 [Citrus unshiu]|nr:hypothetical protein CUMW_119280 [Citrus unshiu]